MSRPGLFSVLLAVLAARAGLAAAGGDALLSAHVRNRAPWLTWEANSDQRQPVYLGLSPLQLALELSTAPPVVLPSSLREAGQAQAVQVARTLGQGTFALEAWPARDDEGRLAWTFARWSPGHGAPWRWLESVPLYRMAVPAQRRAVFADFRELDGLYDKPLFGDCVWTSEEGAVVSAWLAPEKRQAAGRAGGAPAPLCRILPQPSFLNGRPESFVLTVEAGRVAWPEALVWRDTETLVSGTAPAPPDLSFPVDLAARLRVRTRGLAGEDDLVLPDGRALRLTRKSSADKEHQLEALNDYLQARYAALGLKTRRLRFSYQGQPQSDLIAVIPGSLPAEKNRPVLLADHIDTAFAEDVFKASGQRRSVPGADDNAVAAAALLEAASVLKDSKPRHDLWLVHLTGEEYPADDLGARRLIRELLAERRLLTGVIVMDMIGYREAGDPVFQLSAGDGRAAERLARAAELAARREAPGLSPRLRGRFDPKSYLYNTDALIFSEAGYPALLVNEHLNAAFNLERRHYHESTDTSERMDFDFAAALARTAIAAAAAMAGVADPGPRLPPDHLRVPLARQATPYSCGAAAMQSVLAYWAVFDGGESDLYGPLQTTPKEGTDPRTMTAVARSFGLQASWREGSTIEELQAALRNGETVILDLQAWREQDPTPRTWEDNWDDGHYVVLIGMDDRYLYLMDPAVTGAYASLPLEELDERWRDYEDRDGRMWRNRRLAIFISGTNSPASHPGPLVEVR